MDMKSIQAKLFDAFEASEMTYDELAKRTNLPKSALHRYLNGDTEKIPIDRFQAICDELHVEASSILGWTDKDPSEDLVGDERKLIKAYRGAEPTYQKVALELLETHQKDTSIDRMA